MARYPKTFIVPAQELPVLTEADVCIIGGGTAGFCAAVGAARAGARTVLVERSGFLGGSVTGTYNTNPGWTNDSHANHIVGGVGWEFLERMEQKGYAVVDRQRWRAQIFPEGTKFVALEMVAEAGVELYLHTWFSETLMEGETIHGAVVQNKSGRQVIDAACFVDASGDADVAYHAGAPYEKLDADNLWQTSVDLTVCNIDAVKVIDWARANREKLDWAWIPDVSEVHGVQNMFTFLLKGGYTVRLDGESNRAGEISIAHKGPVPTVKLMIRRSTARVQGSVEIDGTDVRQLTWAEIEGRRRALGHLRFLQENIPGFEEAFVIGQSPLGVRETRRIIGEYVITLDDLLHNSRFDDVVALNARALDKHLKDEHFSYQILEGNHDIPLRALTPQGVQNLLVAGRCISSDHESNASLRGAATCFATGHAAGVAAALSAQHDGKVRSLDIGLLQRTLVGQKAILSTDPHRHPGSMVSG
jgi:hypothetical protein